MDGEDLTLPTGALVSDCCLDVDVDGDGDGEDDGEEVSCLLSTLYISHQGINTPGVQTDRVHNMFEIGLG